ncbi:hypothetical protein LEN26_001399 [Aphanomyces euteiches]|nr:hypothetical protein LEN26_001399 [Aphanomyces euteiches]
MTSQEAYTSQESPLSSPQKRKHNTPDTTTPVQETKRHGTRRPKRLSSSTESSEGDQPTSQPLINLVTSSSEDSDKSLSPRPRNKYPTRRQSAKPGTTDSYNQGATGRTTGRRKACLRPGDVLRILEQLFEEVEADDRAMYKVTDDVIRDETATCDKSDLVESTNTMELRRMCTYGEVLPEDFSRVIIPHLQLTSQDVFYDLGCGTGKIVLHVALETPCVVAKGMELMLNRVIEGQRALERVQRMCPRIVREKVIRIVQGDMCHPPDDVNMMDATVVFINNVVFPPLLMTAVLEILGRMKRLKRVVTMRKLCERHRDERCARQKSPCVTFAHPPEEAKVLVSWAKHASCYIYHRVTCV